MKIPPEFSEFFFYSVYSRGSISQTRLKALWSLFFCTFSNLFVKKVVQDLTSDGDNEQSNKGIQLMWCILLILLPIALLFAESSMNDLQSVSIVAAFPIGAVIVMIAVSFMKDAKKYMESLDESAKEKGEK